MHEIEPIEPHGCSGTPLEEAEMTGGGRGCTHSLGPWACVRLGGINTLVFKSGRALLDAAMSAYTLPIRRCPWCDVVLGGADAELTKIETGAETGAEIDDLPPWRPYHGIFHDDDDPPQHAQLDKPATVPREEDERFAGQRDMDDGLRGGYQPIVIDEYWHQFIDRWRANAAARAETDEHDAQCASAEMHAVRALEARVRELEKASELGRKLAEQRHEGVWKEMAELLAMAGDHKSQISELRDLRERVVTLWNQVVELRQAQDATESTAELSVLRARVGTLETRVEQLGPSTVLVADVPPARPQRCCLNCGKPWVGAGNYCHECRCAAAFRHQNCTACDARFEGPGELCADCAAKSSRPDQPTHAKVCTNCGLTFDSMGAVMCPECRFHAEG